MTSKQKNVTLKYLVVGDSGVGKTCMLVRYCDENFQTDYLSTIGVDFKIKRIQHQGQQITLNIWDTAGQQRFRNITKSFYKGAHGIVIAYSITDLSSFEHVERWIQQIRQVGNQKVTMIIVGTKEDLQAQRKVKKQQGQELAQKYDLDFLEVSSKTGTNVDSVFQILTKTVIENTPSISAVATSKQTGNGGHQILSQNNKNSKNESTCCG